MTDEYKKASAVKGDLHVSNKVFAEIAGHTALECYGVVGMASLTLQDGVAKLLPKSSPSRGVVVVNGPEGISVDLYVIIEQGNNLNTVSENLANQVRFALTEYTKAPVADVRVHVQGVRVKG